MEGYEELIEARKKEIELEESIQEDKQREFEESVKQQFVMTHLSSKTDPRYQCGAECPFEAVPHLENIYACTDHLNFHTCRKNKGCPIITGRTYDLCGISGNTIDCQLEEGIPIRSTRRGVGARSRRNIKYNSNSGNIIAGIVDALFVNRENRAISYEFLINNTNTAASKSLGRYFDARAEVYEGNDQAPLPCLTEMINHHEMERRSLDVFSARPISSSEPVKEWVEIAGFNQWRNCIELILHTIWTTMEETGFKRTTNQRIQEVVIYILYILKHNKVLSVGGTRIIDREIPPVRFLPPDDVLNSLPQYPIPKTRFHSSQFSAGKKIFNTYFQELIQKRKDVVDQLIVDIKKFIAKINDDEKN